MFTLPAIDATSEKVRAPCHPSSELSFLTSSYQTRAVTSQRKLRRPVGPAHRRLNGSGACALPEKRISHLEKLWFINRKLKCLHIINVSSPSVFFFLFSPFLHFSLSLFFHLGLSFHLSFSVSVMFMYTAVE